MVKRFALVVFFVYICQSLIFGQNHTAMLSVGMNRLNFENAGERLAIEAEMNIFLGDYFAINSRFQLGKDYAHLPLTFAVLSALSAEGMCESLGDGDEYAILLLILVTEGVSLTPVHSDNFIFALYANPLGWDFLPDENLQNEHRFSFDNMNLSGTFGMKFNFIYEHFTIAPYVELKKLYNGKDNAMGFGVSLGAIF